MKLKLKNITYGLVPFGPAIGQRSLLIDIQEEEIKDYDLFKDFKKKIKKFEKQYIDAVNGTQSTFLIFKGGSIEKNEYALDWEEFYNQLSSDSLSIQKTLKLRPDQLRPPFCIFVGVPTEFSSKRENIGEVFQYFTCCYAVFDSEEYNQLGLQQLINHQFASVCIKVKNEDFSLVKSLRKKFSLNKKCCIIDYLDNESCMQFCLDEDVKYYKSYDYSKERWLEI